MSISWTDDQPVVKYVRDLIWHYFPAVSMWHDATLTGELLRGNKSRKNIRDHRLHGVGGYKNRTTEDGGLSLHSEGRAADIYVDTRNAYLTRFGDELFQRLVSNGKSLGIDRLIWRHQVWTGHTEEVEAFPKNNHLNHMHLGFTRASSQVRNPLLETLIKQAAQVTDAAFP